MGGPSTNSFLTTGAFERALESHPTSAASTAIMNCKSLDLSSVIDACTGPRLNAVGIEVNELLSDSTPHGKAPNQVVEITFVNGCLLVVWAPPAQILLHLLH